MMELIEGKPIHEYCQQQALSVSQILQLFTQVCSAVQYAHSHLIVHRDIKPSNILVTTDGIPKLLDFGIAKILDASSAGTGTPTVTMFQVLTPSYASPEQIKGEAITTATDVYSLGVVLYELLAGESPYRVVNRTMHEITDAICEQDPPRPSTAVRQRIASAESKTGAGASESLSQRLRGDVDNILLMALRKEPDRRYASVEQFAQDIQRHIDNLPVLARQGTLRYRSGKFVIRHKAAVAASVIATLALVVGLVVSVREARIAQRRFNDVRSLADSLIFDVHDSIKDLPGSAPARHLVVQRSLQYLDKLHRDAAGNRDLLRDLAAGYQRIAELQGAFTGRDIGDSQAALESYRKALSIRKSLVASSNHDLSELKNELALLQSYFYFVATMEKTEEMTEIAELGLKVAEEIQARQPQDLPSVLNKARAHIQLASALGGNGSVGSSRDVSAALIHDREALAILSEIDTNNPTVTTIKGLAQVALGFHLSKARRFEESARAFEEVSEPEQKRRMYPHRFLAIMYNDHGWLYERMGDQKRALEEYRRSFAAAQSLMNADPTNLDSKLIFEAERGHIAMQEARLGDSRRGLKELQGAIADVESMLGQDRTKSFYAIHLAVGYAYCAEILSSLSNQPAALEEYAKALTTMSALSEGDPQDLDSRLTIAKIHAGLAIVLARAARFEEAHKEFTQAMSISQQLLRIRPEDEETLYLLGQLRTDEASLATCSSGRRCDGKSRFAVPTMLN